MKITKYLHSCLVFELEEYKILFDPGKFSFAEGLVSPSDFGDVDHIIITHIHPDHLDIANLKEIAHLSNAPIATTAQVAEALAKEGLACSVIEEGISNLGPFKLQAMYVTHEPLLDNPTPQMVGFLINDKVLHPVDSMENALLKFKGIELLLMVSMAPFATELRIAGFADKLQPGQILPVHDGYAKGFFIEQRNENYRKHFEKQGIQYHAIYKPGESITI